jgi:hypothetical protein
MDIKIVNKYIKTEIWPVLKDQGFSIFSPKTAWRYIDDEFIHVINFQSFNEYNASIIGCTTFSFSVNIGLYNLAIFNGTQPKRKKGRLIPNEYECHFRNRLTCSYKQKKETIFNKNFDRNDIWYVKQKGENLSKVFIDVKDQIMHNALPWYNKYSNQNIMFELTSLKTKPDDGTWGYGNPNKESPRSCLFSACIAKKINLYDLSKSYFNKVLKTDSYKNIYDDIQKIIAELE